MEAMRLSFPVQFPIDSQTRSQCPLPFYNSPNGPNIPTVPTFETVRILELFGQYETFEEVKEGWEQTT